MEAYKLLIDSDAFLLLAGAQLLDRVLELLGFTAEHAARLDPLPHMIGKNRKLRTTYPPDFLQRAALACGSVQGIRERPADDLFQRLVNADSIDPGEALLYGLLAEKPCWLLASGDKRAMVAVACDPKLASVRAAIAGRVLCFEAIVRLLVASDGAKQIANAFQPMLATHKSQQIHFSEHKAVNDKDCLRGLESYFRDLRRQTGAGFLFEPKEGL